MKREEFAQNLTQLVQTLRQPFVLAINGPWGTGKTTFIRMLAEHLRKAGHVCCYYNAWENDFSEEPLLGFLTEIQTVLQAAGYLTTAHPRAAKAWGQVRGAAARVFKKMGPIAVQLATQGLVSAEQVKALLPLAEGGGDVVAQLAGDSVRELLNHTRESREAIRAFQQGLSELAESIGEKGRTPIVCFVDELDRCRPLYAIALLERIKHFFGAPGVVFVLAVDREQIGHSLRSVYGQGMDADGYLRRFIDLRCDLPSINVRDFCNDLWRRFDLDGAIGVRQDARQEKDFLILFLRDICSLMKLSLRSAEQLFTEVNVVVRATPPTQKLLAPVMPLLMLLRSHAPVLLHRYASGDAGAGDVFDFLSRTPEAAVLFKKHHWKIARAYLLRWSRNTEEQARLRKAAKDASTAAADNRGREHPEFAELLSMVSDDDEDLLDYCLRRVTLSCRFTIE